MAEAVWRIDRKSILTSDFSRLMSLVRSLAAATLAAAATAALTACSAAGDIAAPRSGSEPRSALTPPNRPSTSVAVSSNSDGTLLTFSDASGSFTVDVAHGLLKAPYGPDVLLTPDAVDQFRTAYNNILTSDATATRLSTARPPSIKPTCNPRLQTCGPAQPQFAPGGWGGRTDGPTTLSTSSTSSYTVDQSKALMDGTFSCRDISTAMATVMPQYRAAKENYVTALKAVALSALKSMGRTTRNPDGTWTPPQGIDWDKPQSWTAIVGFYTAEYGAAAAYTLAASNYESMMIQLNFLGGLFNAYDCLNTPWDPAPTNTTPSGGGGVSSSAGGGWLWCTYRLLKDADGNTISSTLLYCVPV